MRRDRKEEKPQAHTSWGFLGLVVLAAGIFGWYTLYDARGVSIEYDNIDKITTKTATAALATVELPRNSSPLRVPIDAFASSTTWVYISKFRQVPASYKPAQLVGIGLAHAASDTTFQIDARALPKLKSLFDAAAKDDINLMITSAYRSVSEQQSVYDDFVAKKGKTMADQYVAKPGTSEHHSGLAVDITDASSACEKDVDRCNLSPNSSSWLAEHAPDYGFIIRYPSGKQPVTGVAYEPWHLRYVGVVMARQVTASDLAYDEVVKQIAPGYFTTR